MRPRLALLLGAALVVPVLPFTPAYAAGTICVNMGTACPTGASTALTIQAALNGIASGTTVLVGPGNSYTDGPYTVPAGVTLRGSGSGTGSGATVLTLAPGPAQTYLTASSAAIIDVRLVMDGTTAAGDTGLSLTNASTANNVRVLANGGAAGIEAGVALSGGSTATEGVVTLPQGTGGTPVVDLNTGVTGSGNTRLVDSEVTGDIAFGQAVAGTADLARVTLHSSRTGVDAAAGTVNVTNSLLDLESGGATGVLARAAGTVAAKGLTVLGGGAGSVGVSADAAAGQSPSLSLSSSIVWGPATSLALHATGGGTPSLTVSYTDYQTKTGAVTDGGNNLVGVDPQFMDAAAGNYVVKPGSPVLDKGQPGVALPGERDRAGNARVVDGNLDGSAIRDMGAFERVDVTPPKTVFTAGPSGLTNDNTPVFTFRSGPATTFQCALDGGAFQPCTSPVTTTPLPDGPHSFTVRATDAALNVETTPATKSFTVDTRAPDTVFSKKPHKRFFRSKVKFKFASPEAGAHFQCLLDNQSWRPCRSPLKYKVSVGKHRLLVRAVDAAGNTDSTPARYKFKRLKRRR